jgi:rare lipoprotein A
MSSCARTRYISRGNIQTGLASWYGPDFHGKKTSSKEIFNMYDLTAAHNTLPFGTYVMVTNLENGKSVRVRINDRGPFVRGRIIDLSYAAARVLGMIGPGVSRVRVEVLNRISHPKSSHRFSVQVGAFISKENAEALKLQIKKRYENVYISTFKTSNQVYYRVRVGAKSLVSAHEMARELLKQGFAVIVLEEI